MFQISLKGYRATQMLLDIKAFYNISDLVLQFKTDSQIFKIDADLLALTEALYVMVPYYTSSAAQ